MGQSLVKNFIHIIFSTKNHFPFIKPPVESELHKYIGGICSGLGCTPLKVGGHKEHIHIICMLSKKIALMDLIEEIKSHSSKFMKTKGELLKKFYWQDGYGAFSVNPSEVDKVISYIENQHEHHKKRSFKDEYLAFLKKYKVDYDERYIWK